MSESGLGLGGLRVSTTCSLWKAGMQSTNSEVLTKLLQDPSCLSCFFCHLKAFSP